MMYELTTESATLTGRIKPLTALRALLRFLHDPEDTPQVFRIVRALDGSTAERAFQRFCATRTGRAILARESTLAAALMDRDALRSLPEDSLGRGYLNFVEAEKISVEGLLSAAERGGIHASNLELSRRLYRGRLHAMHDLLHVITGYGTDELGEACLLAFTYSQNRSRGLLPIIWGLTVRLKIRALRLRVLAAITEGFRLGARAEWLTAQDWENLLGRPLQEIRQNLCVNSPRQYLAQLKLSLDADDRRRKRLAASS